MKNVAVALVALLAIASGCFFFNSVKKTKTQSLSVVQSYNEWKLKFGKLYATPSENGFRMTVFANSLSEIEGFNAEYEQQLAFRGLPPLSGPMFALQKHSDLTKAEFEATMLGLKLPAEFVMDDSNINVAHEQPIAPKKLGQSSTFQVRIRNQGDCGAGWAFSAVAVTEKFFYDQINMQIDFSQQDLLNCVTDCNGCSGGWPTTALVHVGESGLPPAAYFPYVGVQGVCSKDIKRLKMPSNWEVRQMRWSPAISTKAQVTGVWGAIKVAASGRFRALSNTAEVYDASLSGECTDAINHSVTAIGSPSDGVVSVMNSWGKSWAVNGVKKIKACSSSLIWGSPSLFIHPYVSF